MSRSVAWFAAGVLAAVLVLSGGFLVSQQNYGIGAPARAETQNTWHSELFDTSSINNGAMAPDTDRFVDDWIGVLPSNCDIVPIQSQPLVIAYRCP